MNGDGETGKIVTQLQHIFSRWQEGVGATKRTVKAIRQQLLPDDIAATTLINQYSIDIGDIEEREIAVKWPCIHGDLHGANVLVDDHNNAMVIDFGDVGPGPAALDPVTLELSLFFHPDALPENAVVQPAVAQGWANLDGYAEQFAAKEFIRSCRQWAHAVAAGDREVFACCYAYALRQLKYQDTNKDIAIALVRASLEALKASF